MSTPAADKPPPLDTLIDAHYRKLVDAPEAARRRAQAGYVVAAAVAAATATAGVATKLGQGSLPVKLIGPAALVAWLVSAALYVRAVAVPFEDPKAPATAGGAAAFIAGVLTAARTERAEIDRRQRVANGAAALAAVLTSTAIALALFLPAERDTVRMNLSAEAFKRLSALCTRPLPGSMSATLDRQAPGSTVEVELAAGSCGPKPVKASIKRDDMVFLLTR